MQFQLLQLFSFILYFFSSIVSADAAERFVTKDGVIYRYAVKTKTLQPARVVVSTRYYTTVHVREITLANNEVTSTTEQITTEATVTSSIPAITATSSPDNNDNDALTTTSAISVAPTSSVETMNTDAQATSTQGTKSTITLSPSQNNSPSVDKTSTSTSLDVPTTSSIPTTITSTSEVSRTSNAQVPVTTSMNDDGSCHVYYEDDEYYSTFYITASSQSIDAASTITSTRTKTIYQTVSN